jgi:hypothetical protein
MGCALQERDPPTPPQAFVAVGPRSEAPPMGGPRLGSCTLGVCLQGQAASAWARRSSIASIRSAFDMPDFFRLTAKRGGCASKLISESFSFCIAQRR